jgi:hypothetical protein
MKLCAKGGAHVPQVPIYTLHMLTFPEPERFWPERWAEAGGSGPKKLAAGEGGAPTEVHVQVRMLQVCIRCTDLSTYCVQLCCACFENGGLACA